ncbi:MAG: efflux RND transporter periplasmic adaptor subunit [Deltaproteobacteria bacterium]|nr:efflux RND transporter periplasmic adaptor subunit [Deltaproteobacteria bacterium]
MKRALPFVVVGVIALVLVVLFSRRIGQSTEKNAAAKAATDKVVIAAVKTAVIATKDLPQILQITGSVKAQNEVQVLPRSPGRVTQVRVDVGAVVKAGDVLAVIEAIDMSLRVKQADAQLQAARAGLEQAKVQQAAAQRGFERAQSLKAKGAMSQIDFEGADVGSQLAAVGILGAQAQVSLAEANLGLVQKAFEDTRITTPIAGVVTKKMVNVGTFANPAAPAFSVQDQSSLKLEGTVPAGYVAQLKAGMKVEILVDELPGRSFEGTLSRVAPTLEQETRRGAIEVSLAPGKDLLPYMFGRAQIAFGNTADVVVVPSSAVLSVAGQPGVYVVRNDKAALVRPRLGAKHDNDVVVEEGLAVGDAVVVSGDAGLKDGANVHVSGS